MNCETIKIEIRYFHRSSLSRNLASNIVFLLKLASDAPRVKTEFFDSNLDVEN